MGVRVCSAVYICMEYIDTVNMETLRMTVIDLANARLLGDELHCDRVACCATGLHLCEMIPAALCCSAYHKGVRYS